MKIVKNVGTVLLVIILLVSAVVATGTIILNRTILNPDFYGKTLQKAGAYDGVYNTIMGNIQTMADETKNLPDSFKGEMTNIIGEAMPVETFTALFSKMMGESVNWIFYNGPEVHMPFRDMVEPIREQLAAHPAMSETQGLEGVMNQALTIGFKGYILPEESGDTLRDYIHYYMGGGGQSEWLNQNLNFQFDVVFPAYVDLVTKGLYISLGVFLLCVILLGVIWRKKLKIPVAITGYTVAIMGAMSALGGAGVLYMKERVMAKMESVNHMLPPFVKGIESALMTQMAVGILIGGVIVLLVGIGVVVSSHFIGREKPRAPRLVEKTEEEAA